MRKVVVAAVAASVLGLPAGAQAATVTSTADSGPGSLRAAIADTPDGGTVDFQAGVTGTINLQSELGIGKSLTIQGPGARVLSVSGQDTVRVLSINAPGEAVNLSGLTLTKGRSAGIAAGIRIVAGTVNISDSAITANVDPGGQFTAFGGGIFVDLQSVLTLTRSLVAANGASAAGPLVNAWGGGLIVFGTAMIVDSSIVDNRAEATADLGGTAFAEGGGIFVQNGGVVSVVRSTVARNEARASGGGAGTFSAGGGMRLAGPGTLAGSVVAENTVSSNVAATGPDCAGQVTVAAPSLIENASACTISGSGAITGVAPGFAADGLADHGGPTDTLALAAGAPALNQLPTTDPNCTGAITDQRGIPRPQGSACDLGAFEARPPSVVASPSSHDYGSVLVGQTSPAQSYTLTNQGDLPAVDLNPTLTDGTHFTFDNAGCFGFTLNPRAANSCTVSSAFKPAASGAHTTMLHVAGGFTGDVATLTGTGTLPAAAAATTATATATATAPTATGADR